MKIMEFIAIIDWNRILEPPASILFAAFIVALVSMIAPQWRKAHRDSELTRLKESMIQRGYSADEIERVARAGQGGDAGTRKPRSRTDESKAAASESWL
jgi:hypothetical protein